MTATDVFKGLSTVAKIAGKVLPPPAGMIASYLSEALALGADLATAAIDPVAEIKRIHDMHPRLKAVDKAWRDAFAKKFGEPL